MREKEEGHEDVKNKFIEVQAKSVDEAIAQGLTQLNLSPEQVEIEVIKEGKRGVFGLGAEDAQVRLKPLVQEGPDGLETPSEEGAVLEPSEEGAVLEDVAPSREVVEAAEEPPEDAPPAAASDDISEAEQTQREPDVEALAEEYLRGLLDRMGIKAEIARGRAEELVEPGEAPPLILDIRGQDLGILIGRRSETLRALQYVLRLMVSKQISRWYPIVVDVESYRVRRRRSLRQLADKMAERAVSSRRKVVLEAMPAYERRLVHLALRDHPQVTTKSIGSGDNRKVTIVPK